MASIQKECEDSIVTTIQALGLTGITSAEIVARRSPWCETVSGQQGYIHRGITIYPVPELERHGTNEREEIGFGVGIAMIVPGDHAGTTNRDLIPTWRSTIRRKIIRDTITITESGANFCDLTWEHGRLSLPREFFNWELSDMVARCWVRQTRT